MVGSRHIPITKFSRAHTRGRGGDGIGGKRVTGINFYQSNHTTQASAKLKNALDLSMNKYENGAGNAVNDSVISGTSNNIFIGGKPGTSGGSKVYTSNGRANAQAANNVYTQQMVMQGTATQFEVFGVSKQKQSPQGARFTESRG